MGRLRERAMKLIKSAEGKDSSTGWRKTRCTRTRAVAASRHVQHRISVHSASLRRERERRGERERAGAPLGARFRAKPRAQIEEPDLKWVALHSPVGLLLHASSVG